jgi:hypothetical protein
MTVSVVKMVVTADILSLSYAAAAPRRRGELRRKDCILSREMLRNIFLKKRN